MSERGYRSGRNTEAPFARLSVLDRLIDQEPGKLHDSLLSPAESLDALRHNVRRDLEALLNARRRWRSWPDGFSELNTSPVGYGISDFSSGAFNDPRRRELLRFEVEQTIRRFEPRLVRVSVRLLDPKEELEAMVRLRIEGLLRVEPAPDPIAFDTLVDAASAEIVVKASGGNSGRASDNV